MAPVLEHAIGAALLAIGATTALLAIAAIALAKIKGEL